MPKATTVRPHKRMRLDNPTHFITWNEEDDEDLGYIAHNNIGTVFVKFDDKGNVRWTLCNPGQYGRKVSEIDPTKIIGIDSGNVQKFSLRLSLSSFIGAFHVDDRHVYRRHLRSVKRSDGKAA